MLTASWPDHMCARPCTAFFCLFTANSSLNAMTPLCLTPGGYQNLLARNHYANDVEGGPETVAICGVV